MQSLTAVLFSARGYVATWSADRYSRSASVATVVSATVAQHAEQQFGANNGGRPIAVTSKASQAESPTAAASSAIGSGCRPL